MSSAALASVRFLRMTVRSGGMETFSPKNRKSRGLAKCFVPLELGRPAAGRIQDRVPPVCSMCRFVSFLFVILGDGDGELEIVFVIRTRDVERGPGQRQILADDVQTGRNGNLFVK